jgi:ferredoxin-NADP reductase
VVAAPELRLLASVRSPAAAMYRDELAGFDVVWTREAPPGATRPPGRLDAELLASATVPPASSPTCLVCGPTAFVERVAELLVDLGHDSGRIRTERFGSAR